MKENLKLKITILKQITSKLIFFHKKRSKKKMYINKLNNLLVIKVL